MNSPDFQTQLQQARQFTEEKKLPSALKAYAELAKQFPHENFLEEHGRAAALAGDHALAGRLWEKLFAREPDNAALASRLAAEYGKLRFFSRSRDLCAQAASLLPQDLSAQLSLATFLSLNGGVSEARDAVNNCLALNPHSDQARYLSAHLDRRENRFAEAEHQFRELLASARDQNVILYSHFELARALDRMERYDEATEHLFKAKEQISRTMNLETAEKEFNGRREKAVRKAQSLPLNILAVWNKTFPPEARDKMPPLTFLGGHARSGTTLLERVLGAHPAIMAGDESLAFQTIAPLIDVTLPEIPASGLNFLRQRYLKNFTHESGIPGEHTILLDKNPAATAYLPGFLRAFPELRAVIALRDPRDVVVSCFFQGTAYVSHLSFEHLAEHYASTMEVWLAVKEWEGLNWTETRYEDIVADLPTEGARVTKFLGLDWHDSQSAFHEKNRKKPVMSVNYTDVTQPIYKRAVGRWQAYEKYLAPILPDLEPYCKKFGYA